MSPGLIGFGPRPLMAAIASRSLVKTRAGPSLAVDAVGIDDAGIDRRALDHRAFRAPDCRAESETVLVRPRLRAASGDMMTSSGSTPSRSSSSCAQPRAALRFLPPVEHSRPASRPLTVRHVQVEQPSRAGAASPRARRRPGTAAPSDGRPGRWAAHRRTAAPGG